MRRITITKLIPETAIIAEETQKKTEKIIKAFVAEIKLELCKGNSVMLKEFCTLKPVRRKARKGYNPATGEIIEIPAADSIRLKVSKRFKNILNG